MSFKNFSLSKKAQGNGASADKPVEAPATTPPAEKPDTAPAEAKPAPKS